MKLAPAAIALLIAGCGPKAPPIPPDPTAAIAPAEVPLRAQALAGPYESLEEYCDQLERANRRAVTASEPIDDTGQVVPMSAQDAAELEGADQRDCRLRYYYEEDELDDDADDSDDDFFGFDMPVEGPSEVSGAAPILEARVLPFGEREIRCRIAVRTSAGWYVQDRGVPCAHDNGSLHGRTDELAVRDVLEGGDPELIWRFTTVQRAVPSDDAAGAVEGAADAPDETAGTGGTDAAEAAEPAPSPTSATAEEQVELQTVVLCGVGTSGVPSCYEGLLIAGRATRGTGESGDGAGEPGWVGRTEVERAFELPVQYGSTGIAVHGRAPDPALVGTERAEQIRQRLGRHPIAFE